MRSNNVRDITFLDVIVKSAPEMAYRHKILFFLKKLSELHDAKKTERWNRTNTERFFVRDIEINEGEGYAIILLCHNDKNASPASYSHLLTDAQRLIPPNDGEGSPETAHLLISLTEKDDDRRYLAILEESNKVNKYKIISYLNWLFKEFKKADPAKFETEHPDGAILPNGKPNMLKFTNHFEIQGHPSDEFKAMLENGRLLGITLETDVKDKYVHGDGKLVEPSTKELKLKPVHGKWYENAAARFQDALSFGRSNKFERTKIILEAPDKKSHTVRVDSETGNVIGDSFIKRNRLADFKVILLAAEEKISPQIKGKMLELLK